jgi:predicted urease superfamily metal-dependent hydrolase
LNEYTGIKTSPTAEPESSSRSITSSEQYLMETPDYVTRG